MLESTHKQPGITKADSQQRSAAQRGALYESNVLPCSSLFPGGVRSGRSFSSPLCTFIGSSLLLRGKDARLPDDESGFLPA